VSYALSGTHVEKLVLTGSGDTDGTGNSLDNSLTGNSGANVLKGASGHDILKGMGGDDRLEGGSGNDRLVAGSGDDKLEGGSGRDRLYGSRGDDRLEGGADDDRLTGGSGDDIFVFQEGGGRDVVTDFRNGVDKIDVSQLDLANSDLRVRQSGHDAIVEHGSDVLVLKGVNASDLDGNDFIF
jgi:Ca2+-binding RTX toxin-like protein